MSLHTRPFAHVPELDHIAAADPHNLARRERVAGAVLGAALLGYAGWRRSWPSAIAGVAGGALLLRGATGRCPLYRALEIDTARPHRERGVRGGIKVEKSIRIRRSADDLFQCWRHLENLPRFFPHVIAVEEETERLSHWTVRGPAGRTLEWDAEIIEEKAGELIVWQTLPGAQVASAGSVRFESHGDETEVRLNLSYHPAGGAPAAFLAKLFGHAPEAEIARDLEGFRAAMESGDPVPVTV